MAKTVVAIVGRANVGKSTLFNKIAGERVSIVEDIPGVTRDRIYYDTEWNGKPIMMIDTGGFEPTSEDTIKSKMREQAQIAIEMADVIVFLCDVRAGVTADDRDIGTMLMKSGKPVIVAVNKVDSIGALPMEYYEFYELGFDGDPVAVIGKPNAGKSSLVNRILGEDRMIVSDIAGTTRDAIDSRVENEYGKYTFIDTAGIRRQSKVTDKIEKFSVLRAHSAVERADVCLIMIDASEGITEQDEKIAGLAHEGGKGSIIVVNKWDKIEKDNGTVKKFTDDIYLALSYMTYAPLIFISAKTGQRTEKLFEKINFVAEKNAMRISTGMLNDVLSDAISRVQPPTDKGKRLKIYYMTQVSTKPPTFVIFCNDAQLFHFSYQRYIENKLREVFGFEGTPIRFIIRERSDEDKD